MTRQRYSFSLLFMLLCQPAVASTGYFPDGWGAASRGYAGSGAAIAEEPLSMANNPASLAGLHGRELQFDVLLLKAYTTVDIGPLNADPADADPGAFALPPGRIESDPEVPGDIFVIPQFALSWRLNAHSAIGLAVYGNGGLNSTYDDFDNPVCPPESSGQGVYCSGGAGVDIAQTFISPTYAHQFGDWLRIGVAPILAIQAFEARGLSAFGPVSRDPDALTNNGHDYSLGYGAKLGAQLRLAPRLSMGLVYQTRVRVDPFDDYAGLLPDEGRLNIPPLAQVGLAVDVTPRLTWMLDWRRVFFSRVAAQANSPDAPAPLGASGGPGFGWGNGTSFSTAIRYDTGGPWVWRAGYRYSRSPVDSEQFFFNLLAASVLKHHVSVGAHYRLSRRIGLDFSFLYAFENDRQGQNSRFPAQRIEASLSDIEMDLSLRYRF